MITRPPELKPNYLTTIFFSFCLVLTLATAMANARELSQDEVMQLKNSLDTVIVRFQETLVLERELEEEIVVGRALLLLERKKSLELFVDEANEGLLVFYAERLVEIEWLHGWHSSYTTLTRRTPSRLAFYELLDTEKANKYSKLCGALHRCLAEVIDSNGEQSKIAEMQTIQREIEFLERNMTAKVKAQRLTDKQTSMLNDAVYSSFTYLYQASSLEKAIEGEPGVGRALLMLEKKKELEMKEAKITKDVTVLDLRGIGRIEWLSDWIIAYRRLTIGTPSRLVDYQQVDQEMAKEYRNLVASLQKSMIEVIRSSGERSKVNVMKEIQEKISIINESSP